MGVADQVEDESLRRLHRAHAIAVGVAHEAGFRSTRLISVVTAPSPGMAAPCAQRGIAGLRIRRGVRKAARRHGSERVSGLICSSASSPLRTLSCRGPAMTGRSSRAPGPERRRRRRRGRVVRMDDAQRRASGSARAKAASVRVRTGRPASGRYCLGPSPPAARPRAGRHKNTKRRQRPIVMPALSFAAMSYRGTILRRGSVSSRAVFRLQRKCL